MDTINVGSVNGIAITAFKKDETFYVPIKPICTALGIDDRAQRTKIQEDTFLAPVGVLSTSTGADNRLYEMYCLPLFVIPGWLFSINPNNVAPEAKEKVRKYQWECYGVLYRHFFGDFIESTTMGVKAREIKDEIAAARESLEANRKQEKEIKGKIRELELQYEEVTARMINPEKNLFS